MTESDAISLLEKIQRAFANKDLMGLLKHYHPEVTYFGPAFSHPLEGIEPLLRAFGADFAGRSGLRFR